MTLSGDAAGRLNAPATGSGTLCGPAAAEQKSDTAAALSIDSPPAIGFLRLNGMHGRAARGRADRARATGTGSLAEPAFRSAA